MIHACVISALNISNIKQVGGRGPPLPDFFKHHFPGISKSEDVFLGYSDHHLLYVAMISRTRGSSVKISPALGLRTQVPTFVCIFLHEYIPAFECEFMYAYIPFSACSLIIHMCIYIYIHTHTYIYTYMHIRRRYLGAKVAHVHICIHA